MGKKSTNWWDSWHSKKKSYFEIKDKKRNINIDAIKGLTSVLVVVGHIIQFVISSKEHRVSNIIFCIIYSFHMPLFMFISGYLAYKNNFIFDGEWLYKKFRSLVVPFLSWGFVNWLLKNYWGGWSIAHSGDSILEIILYPDRGYWFLLILFYNCTLLWFIEFVIKCISKRLAVNIIYLRTTIILLTSVLLKWIGRLEVYGLGLLGWYSFFYLGGYWIRYIERIRQNVLKFFKSKNIKVILVILFCILVPFWRFYELPLFSRYLREVYGGCRSGMIMYELILEIYKYIIPILGIITTCVFVTDIVNEKIKIILSTLGKYTLETYILQMFLIRNYVDNLLVDTVLSLALSIILPLGVAKALTYVPVVNFICFGVNSDYI